MTGTSPLTKAAQVMRVLEAGGHIAHPSRGQDIHLLELFDVSSTSIPAWQNAMAACLRHCTRHDDGAIVRYGLTP